MYISPRIGTRRNLLEQDLALSTNNFQKFIVVGDLNAHHIPSPPAPEPTYPRCNNYLDIAISCNFPYPYTIQMENDLLSEHLQVILLYSLQSYVTVSLHQVAGLLLHACTERNFASYT